MISQWSKGTRVGPLKHIKVNGGGHLMSVRNGKPAGLRSDHQGVEIFEEVGVRRCYPAAGLQSV